MLGARKWQCAARRTQHAMHNAIIATHNTQRATRTYAHAGASSSEQRCSRFHPNHNEDHTKQNRVHTRARANGLHTSKAAPSLSSQHSVWLHGSSACVTSARTLATLSSTSTAAPLPPSAGGHRVYTVKKCERVDAHCHSVYAVKAHPRQAGKLNSS